MTLLDFNQPFNPRRVPTTAAHETLDEP